MINWENKKQEIKICCNRGSEPNDFRIKIWVKMWHTSKQCQIEFPWKTEKKFAKSPFFFSGVRYRNTGRMITEKNEFESVVCIEKLM